MSHDINKCNKGQCYPEQFWSTLCRIYIYLHYVLFWSSLVYSVVNYVLFFYFPLLHSNYFIVVCFISFSFNA